MPVPRNAVLEKMANAVIITLYFDGEKAWAEVEFDELFGMDSLSLDELTKGLAAAGVRFELIGFDTCLMGSLEKPTAVAPYARYMVASEEVEPGGGWGYWSWLQYIADHPEKDGFEVGKAICDSYYEKCELNGDEAMATLSVIDLAAIPELLECFDAMTEEEDYNLYSIPILLNGKDTNLRAAYKNRG